MECESFTAMYLEQAAKQKPGTLEDVNAWQKKRRPVSRLKARSVLSMSLLAGPAAH